ncbi:hypothetical protein C2I18_16930 [Paenibacillus sp. PK3_47]|uniref:hypothetical protein n=1 Tax=Paenibacillus sp. PK3_47 TaxID=2072642 RepID=UPI00201DFB50|nr:hypothetical protein [Paenibacillus sp. PK3_47]UQZ35057.1 hypothetical protein C2I18_16930 [Paenibacillus sp. PK3_47]
MIHKSKGMFIKLLGSALLLVTVSASLPAPAAEANYFSDLYKGLQNFSELPGEVNQLQESYQQTMDELQQTKDRLGETQDQLGQTLQDIEDYRAQNVALQEQNRQLGLVVEELRNDRTERENYYNRIKITLLTGVGLLLGYFILVRLLRFGMRQRSRKGDRLH